MDDDDDDVVVGRSEGRDALPRLVVVDDDDRPVQLQRLGHCFALSFSLQQSGMLVDALPRLVVVVDDDDRPVQLQRLGHVFASSHAHPLLHPAYYYC